ncbi:MAG: polysaccharide deacetylase family protein [Acidobacteria bacterium]|nr:polysaccharide deacetylase family protein [Acidobacteriota bacterium]
MNGPLSKRDRLAGLACSGGATRVLEWAARRDCLIVLNYHRIGDASATPFDEEVFSVDVDGFDRQIAYLKRRFTIVTLAEALELIEGSRRFRGPAVLVTFDDGYLDNYQAAFPVLRSHGVQGTFFLVTSYLDDPGVAWWDRIAYWVRNARVQRLRLSYPSDFEIVLPPGRRNQEIRAVLAFLRSPEMRDLERFLRELEQACDPPPLPAGARAFLSWDEAREMAAAGMAIGSHTASHQILSKLTAGQQQDEALRSRQALEEGLGQTVDALAYPVGAQDCFSHETKQALERAGYRAGFSFYGGLNRPGRSDRFDILRFAAGGRFERFRTQVSLAVASGGYWF